jgi:hypothetical protein
MLLADVVTYKKIFSLLADQKRDVEAYSKTCAFTQRPGPLLNVLGPYPKPRVLAQKPSAIAQSLRPYLTPGP